MIAVLLAASLAVGNIDVCSGGGHVDAPIGIALRTLTNGAMTNGSANLDSAGAGFAASDVGRVVCVRGAGASGGLLCSVAVARPSSTRLTLANNASTTVSGALVQLLNYEERTDVVMLSTENVLLSPGATFTQGDGLGPLVGRRIAVGGAGAGGAVLVANIEAVLSDTELQLSQNASATVSGQTARIARTTRVQTTTDEMDEAVTEADLVSALKVWGKLARASGKSLAQMEGQTVVAAVP